MTPLVQRITIRKLEGLPPTTRARKLLSLLQQARRSVEAEARSLEAEWLYWNEVGRLLHDLLGGAMPSAWDGSARSLFRLELALAQHLGLDWADWDRQAPRDRPQPGRRFPFSVYLEDLRSPFNVGSILRTAEAYGFSGAYRSLLGPDWTHPRVLRSAMGADQALALSTQTLAALREQQGELPVLALELGGTPIEDFVFPERGLVLVGSEELGLSAEALAWADASAGRVTLPLAGTKASLNVGVAFGILAAAWTARGMSSQSADRNSEDGFALA